MNGKDDLMKDNRDDAILFERNELTPAGTQTARKRGISTSYGTRRPIKFATLTNTGTQKAPVISNNDPLTLRDANKFDV